MPDAHHDGFGRLITSPAHLTLRERVDALRRVAGELLAARGVEQRWLGTVLVDWLQRGGALEEALGVKPQRGCRNRPETLVRQGETARMLVRLAVLLGSDVRAVRVLRGHEPVPPAAAELVGELRARRAPSSRQAFTRARRATRQSS